MSAVLSSTLISFDADRLMLALRPASVGNSGSCACSSFFSSSCSACSMSAWTWGGATNASGDGEDCALGGVTWMLGSNAC